MDMFVFERTSCDQSRTLPSISPGSGWSFAGKSKTPQAASQWWAKYWNKLNWQMSYGSHIILSSIRSKPSSTLWNLFFLCFWRHQYHIKNHVSINAVLWWCDKWWQPFASEWFRCRFRRARPKRFRCPWPESDWKTRTNCCRYTPLPLFDRLYFIYQICPVFFGLNALDGTSAASEVALAGKQKAAPV